MGLNAQRNLTKIILSNESSQFNKQLALLGQYEYEDEDNDSIKTDIETALDVGNSG